MVRTYTVCHEERGKIRGARFSAAWTDTEIYAAMDAMIVVSRKYRRFIIGST